MNNSKTIEQVLNLLGQIHVSGWNDIQCLVSANLLLTNLKDQMMKQECAPTASITTVKDGE